MSSDLPKRALKSIVTDAFWREQTDTSTRRYVPYSFTQGLRKLMGHNSPDNIQELDANRSFNSGRESLTSVVDSDVSDIFEGEEVTRKQFDLEYNRGSDGEFEWSELRSLFGQPGVIYDLPVRHVVIRIVNEELEERWISALEEAISIDDFPTEWIEPPFFAVLESADPGDSDARSNVKELHEEFYYKPKFRVEENHDGMDWQLRTLDLQSIWSYQAFVNRSEPILTTRVEDRQFDWTPRRIENYLLNYFDSEDDYTGILRDSDFVNLWRRVYSRDVTSTKEFAWEEEEEWVQT